MKILNLYAGIGGNRKLWEDVDVVAIENNSKIAEIYQDFFPNDEVIIADAHQYLLEHFKEFDFIWSSPPCPSHSMFRKNFSCNVGAKPIFPDMKLYEEILFLQYYFKGDWAVENVISYYKPLIEPQLLQRHYFWSNKELRPREFGKNRKFPKDTINLTGGKNEHEKQQVKRLQEKLGINIEKYSGNKRLMLRNCVLPELGLYIFQEAIKKPKRLF